jgi:hypothetical protein
MKTIREWLNELPEDVRDKAIANTSEELLKFEESEDLRDALLAAFIWMPSNEGFDYWFKIYTLL